MLKLTQQQSLQQKLSPQQIQMIHMLESNTLEIEERIQQELVDNPVLEEVESNSRREELPTEDNGRNETDGAYDDADFSMSDYKTDDTPSYRTNINNYSSDDDQRESPLTEKESLQDFLTEQIRLKDLDDTTIELCEYVIGNIDRDGYLRRPADRLVDDLAFAGHDVTLQQMQDAIDMVRSLEPAGVGAADLQDCLVLQLQRKKKTLTVKNAIIILKESFEDFGKRHFDKILRRYSLDEDGMHDVMIEVAKLNPKPGAGWESGFEGNSVHITPDFIVECDGDSIVMSLNNDNIPELRISEDYSNQLEELSKNSKNQSEDMKNGALYIKQKIDSAKWFINSIKQRQDTLRATMEAIISKQREFFMTGDDTKLHAMVLKDIATMTGYDISTISRVCSKKYVQTDWGVFSLKHFFSESMQTESGEEISNKEVKSILEECIQNEDKREPLTDDRLSEILKEKGYVIARRTVAKYRTQMNIPTANMRREI